MKTDNEIQNDVITQLKWNPALNSASIGVAVKNGVVTLTGQVASYAEKRTADHVTKTVAGVKAVAEDIQVGPSNLSVRTDTEIAEAILHALKWNTLIPEDAVEVTVEKGVVTLDGQVDWDYQRKAAVNTIENLLGVRFIINRIAVKPHLVSENIKQKIQQAFQRSASIEANKISVDVVGHTVVLKGHVRSFAEIEEAKSAAWSAPGVTNVEDKLQVELEPEEQFSL
jgi:osmotically-inducible protein OsmY